MNMARPRTTCPSDEELEELGKEMVQWVKDNKPLHLSEWYLREKFIVRDVFKNMIKQEVFYPYYEMALTIVGREYLDKDSKVHPSISQRWQRVYFKDLRDEEDETAKYNASLKQPEQLTMSPQVLSQLLNKSLPIVNPDQSM